MNSNLNKILRYPNKIPCDKRMHGLIGVFLICTLLIFTTNLFILIGSLVSVAWGIEYFQKFTKSGNYDNWDAIAVIIGGLMVLLPFIINSL